MRSTMPVALARETSRASASLLIDWGPPASTIVSTCRWTRLSEPASHVLNARIRSTGFHDVSSSSTPSASRRRSSL